MLRVNELKSDLLLSIVGKTSFTSVPTTPTPITSTQIATTASTDTKVAIIKGQPNTWTGTQVFLDINTAGLTLANNLTLSSTTIPTQSTTPFYTQIGYIQYVDTLTANLSIINSSQQLASLVLPAGTYIITANVCFSFGSVITGATFRISCGTAINTNTTGLNHIQYIPSAGNKIEVNLSGIHQSAISSTLILWGITSSALLTTTVHAPTSVVPSNFFNFKSMRIG
jgi:hypothetical protein